MRYGPPQLWGRGPDPSPPFRLFIGSAWAENGSVHCHTISVWSAKCSKIRPSIVDVRPSIVDVRPSIVDVRPSIVDVRPSIVDVRPSIVDVRPSIVDDQWSDLVVAVYMELWLPRSGTQCQFHSRVSYKWRKKMYQPS